MRSRLTASEARNIVLMLLVSVLITGCQTLPKQQTIIEPSKPPADTDSCFEYLTKYINPTSFETLAAELAVLPNKKDEF